MMHRVPDLLASLIVGLATALLLLGAAIAPFVNPAWVGFAQERAEAAAWTGFTPAELRIATDAILADLVVGPPEFDVEVGGRPVLNERERGHMRDVRGVFTALGVGAAASLAIVAGAIVLARGSPSPWRRIRRAALATAFVTVTGGALALVFFDAAFELFHRLFFAPGTYTFDPTTERLVQLFPYRFWVESATAVGAVLVVLALVVAWATGRLAARGGRSAGRAAIVDAVADAPPQVTDDPPSEGWTPPGAAGERRA